MKSRPWFYSVMGVVALLAIGIGFGRTYAAPVMRGAFTGPAILHWHGAFALSWALLFITQPLLIRWRCIGAHRTLGYIGLPLALGVAATMIAAGCYQSLRDSRTELGDTGISSLLGTVTSATLFVALVIAGIAARHNREAHPRWMLLATLLVIWPAWFRFRHWFPQVPRPELWFGVVLPMAWVGVAMARDRIIRGAVHPVLLFAGSGLVLEQFFELLAFDTPPWRATAKALFLWMT